MSCKLLPKQPAQKCCNACETTKPVKVPVAQAKAAIATVMAVAVAAVVAEAKAAIAAVTPASFNLHARKARVPSKAMAEANNPQVLRTSRALPAHRQGSPTRCVPVST